jgi:hypothetical protein
MVLRASGTLLTRLKRDNSNLKQRHSDYIKLTLFKSSIRFQNQQVSFVDVSGLYKNQCGYTASLKHEILTSDKFILLKK